MKSILGFCVTLLLAACASTPQPDVAVIQPHCPEAYNGCYSD